MRHKPSSDINHNAYLTIKQLTLAISIVCAANAFAQAPAAPVPKTEEKPTESALKNAEPTKLETIVVTGIRASLEKSLDTKKNATANIEVITAEDVGKMPDKNLADSLQRLAGVAVRTDYDEAEKVALRGTNPDMTLIVLNGHTVSGGDWFIADQQSSSRSTSLSLMPSSVLNQALVYKTSQANVIDGGLAGTINVRTRKPLDSTKPLGGIVSIGGVHADLPNKTSQQLNASLDWKNAAGTFGLIGQVFNEERAVRRDSVSRNAEGTSSGWGEINISTMRGITDASLAGTGLKAADLNGVRLPGSMSHEYIEGERDRTGGMFSMQFKPISGVDLTMTGFTSEMKAANYGRLNSGAIYSMLLGFADPAGGTAATSLQTNSGGNRVYASIRNPVITETTSNYGFPLKVLTAGDIVFADGTTPQYVGNSQGFYRDGAKASSSFIDFEASWRVNDRLFIKALAASTKGVGVTERDQGYVYARYGTGISYRLNGLDTAPDSSFIGTGANIPVRNANGSGYSIQRRGAAKTRTVDREDNISIDGTLQLPLDALPRLEVGVRHASHDREVRRSTPYFRSRVPGALPADGYTTFPGDFGDGLGGNFDRSGFYFPSSVLTNFIEGQVRPTGIEYQRLVGSEIDMRELQSAAFAMQEFDFGNWTGNFGVRLVRTQVQAQIATPIAAGRCNRIEPGQPIVPCTAVPDAIVAAGDGASYFEGETFNPRGGTLYVKTPTDRVFRDVLPSFNLRGEPIKNLVLRLGASKTIGRQNYNIYGSGFSGAVCDAQGCRVSGPNPTREPLSARNLDGSIAWYYNRRSVIGMNVFSSRISGYAKTGLNPVGGTIDLVDAADNTVKTYTIQTSSQQEAKIKGLEIFYEQPIAAGFGVTANFSRAKTRVEDGRPMLGASDKAANIGVYFENDKLSARLVYNYRDKYVLSSTAPAPTANSQGNSTINGVVQPVAPLWQAPVANVAFSLGYELTRNFRMSFDATNLTNPARAQYRYSEEEQQKLDISGRQYYLNLRYKF